MSVRVGISTIPVELEREAPETMLDSRPLLLLVLLALGAPAYGQAPPKKKAPASSASMAPDVYAAVLAAAQAKSQNVFGITVRGGDGFGPERMEIGSTRISLVLKLVMAANEGGRYQPTARDRRDLVTIDCGHSDFGKEFNCRSVRVVNAAGVTVRALSHVAETNGYQNGFGAKWSVQEVAATYPVPPLTEGFSVFYTSTAGVEYEHKVSAREVVRELMLKIEPPKLN